MQGIISATYCYLLGAIACLMTLVADALTFAAERCYADYITTSNGYMASKGNLMTGDDVMIVDCAARPSTASRTPPSYPRLPTLTRSTLSKLATASD